LDSAAVTSGFFRSILTGALAASALSLFPFFTALLCGGAKRKAGRVFREIGCAVILSALAVVAAVVTRAVGDGNRYLFPVAGLLLGYGIIYLFPGKLLSKLAGRAGAAVHHLVCRVLRMLLRPLFLFVRFLGHHVTSLGRRIRDSFAARWLRRQIRRYHRYRVRTVAASETSLLNRLTESVLDGRQ